MDGRIVGADSVAHVGELRQNGSSDSPSSFCAWTDHESDLHDGIWAQYQRVFAVPLDAMSVDYTMNFKRNFGRDLDAFIDDNALTLTTVPEPSTAWLTFAGLALMGAFWRRRAR